MLHPVAGGVFRRRLKFQTCTNILNKFLLTIPGNFGLPHVYIYIYIYIYIIRHTIVVCIRSIGPIAIGCFICVNINLVTVLIDISNFITSGGILFKMLGLGINEMVHTSFL